MSNVQKELAIFEKFGFEIEGTRRMAMFGGDSRFHDEHVMTGPAAALTWQVPQPRRQYPGCRS